MEEEEEEMLFREMNPEDEFYMGDIEDRKQPKGCLGALLMLLIPAGSWFITVLLS